MISYMMPDFVVGQRLYPMLLNLQEKTPQMLYPDQNISFIYGCIPNAIWNGGTCILDHHFFLRDEIQEICDLYTSLNIPIALTFTNPLIGEKECWDTYCNMIAEIFHTGKNYILVASVELENYLRKNYPNYKYCRSIVKKSNTAIDYDGIYEFSVLKREYNRNFEFLQSIPIDKRNSVEILTTDPCPENCPRYYTHYNQFAQAQLSFSSNVNGINCDQEKDYTTIITKNEIDEKYVPMGYTHFKLSGRGGMYSMIENIINYFILPEYKDIVRSEIIKTIFQVS